MVLLKIYYVISWILLFYLLAMFIQGQIADNAAGLAAAVFSIPILINLFLANGVFFYAKKVKRKQEQIDERLQERIQKLKENNPQHPDKEKIDPLNDGDTY